MKTLNIEEFSKEMKRLVQERLGDDIVVEVRDIDKNNSTHKKALSINESGSSIGTIIYLDGYYADYISNKDLDVLADMIERSYRDNRGDDLEINTKNILDFEQAKEKICYEIINYEENKEMLESLPHRRVLDLAVVYKLIVKKEAKGSMSTKVTNKLMEIWKVTEEDLWNLAEQNTVRLLKIKFMDSYLMAVEMKVLGDPIAMIYGDADWNKLYILTNEDVVNGACLILNKVIMRSLAEKFGHGFMVVPSSIHETLLVNEEFDNEERADELKEIISRVNCTLRKEDILSNNLYYWDMERDELRMV